LIKWTTLDVIKSPSLQLREIPLLLASSLKRNFLVYLVSLEMWSLDVFAAV